LASVGDSTSGDPTAFVVDVTSASSITGRSEGTSATVVARVGDVTLIAVIAASANEGACILIANIVEITCSIHIYYKA
jgi:hypothetical protein